MDRACPACACEATCRQHRLRCAGASEETVGPAETHTREPSKDTPVSTKINQVVSARPGVPDRQIEQPSRGFVARETAFCILMILCSDRCRLLPVGTRTDPSSSEVTTQENQCDNLEKGR